MNRGLLFNQTIQNTISNYIPYETMICSDINASWIDETIQKLALHKNRAYNVYSRDKNNADLLYKFQSLRAHLKATIK